MMSIEKIIEGSNMGEGIKILDFGCNDDVESIKSGNFPPDNRVLVIMRNSTCFEVGAGGAKSHGVIFNFLDGSMMHIDMFELELFMIVIDHFMEKSTDILMESSKLNKAPDDWLSSLANKGLNNG